MCGIVGVHGPLVTGHASLFKDMLLMDVIRGEDSTGVLQIDSKKNTYEIARCSGHPVKLWDLQSDTNLFDYNGCCSYTSRLLLGHNRYTTSGNSWVKDPHPFDFPNVVGVHNGTLIWTKDLFGHKDYSIDSEILYNHIDKLGIDDAWNSMYGAAALVYWDKVDNTLNLIRNDERSLYSLYDEDTKVLYFASESWMINSAIQRNKTILHPTRTDTEGKKHPKLPTLLTPDTLYVYETDMSNDEVSLKETRKLKKSSGVIGTNGSLRGFPAYNQSKVVNKPHVKDAEPKDSDPVNLGWSAATTKSDVSYRGKDFYLSYAYDSYVKDTKYHIIVGRFIDSDELIRVYARTYGEYKKIKDIINGGSITGVYPSSKKLICTTKARPRLFKSVFDQAKGGTGPVFAIELDYVNLGFDVGKKNNSVLFLPKPDTRNFDWDYEEDPDFKTITDLDVFQERLSDAGQVCAYCSDTLDYHDTQAVHWIDDYTPMCKSCYDKGVDYGSNYYYGAC